MNISTASVSPSYKEAFLKKLFKKLPDILNELSGKEKNVEKINYIREFIQNILLSGNFEKRKKFIEFYTKEKKGIQGSPTSKKVVASWNLYKKKNKVNDDKREGYLDPFLIEYISEPPNIKIPGDSFLESITYISEVWINYLEGKKATTKYIEFINFILDLGLPRFDSFVEIEKKKNNENLQYKKSTTNSLLENKIEEEPNKTNKILGKVFFNSNSLIVIFIITLSSSLFLNHLLLKFLWVYNNSTLFFSTALISILALSLVIRSAFKYEKIKKRKKKSSSRYNLIIYKKKLLIILLGLLPFIITYLSAKNHYDSYVEVEDFENTKTPRLINEKSNEIVILIEDFDRFGIQTNAVGLEKKIKLKLLSDSIDMNSIYDGVSIYQEGEYLKEDLKKPVILVKISGSVDNEMASINVTTTDNINKEYSHNQNITTKQEYEFRYGISKDISYFVFLILGDVFFQQFEYYNSLLDLKPKDRLDIYPPLEDHSLKLNAIMLATQAKLYYEKARKLGYEKKWYMFFPEIPEYKSPNLLFWRLAVCSHNAAITNTFGELSQYEQELIENRQKDVINDKKYNELQGKKGLRQKFILPLKYINEVKKHPPKSLQLKDLHLLEAELLSVKERDFKYIEEVYKKYNLKIPKIMKTRFQLRMMYYWQ